MSAFAATLAVLDGPTAGLAAWEAGFAQPVGIMAPIGQGPVGLGQVAEQGKRTGVVAGLAGAQEEPDRSSLGNGMGLALSPPFVRPTSRPCCAPGPLSTAGWTPGGAP